MQNQKKWKMLFTEIVSVSDKIKCRANKCRRRQDLEAKVKAERFPTIVILDKDGAYSNLKYSSIPGGHELNSFILGMYNVAGPGQKIIWGNFSRNC